MTIKITEAEDKIEGWASGFQNDNHNPGDPGYAEASELKWFKIDNYPVARLTDVGDAQWFKEENEMIKMDGRSYDDMLTSPITEHIFVFDNAKNGYIWDGFHRVGASLSKKAVSIPAYVGVYPDNIESFLSSLQSIPKQKKKMI